MQRRKTGAEGRKHLAAETLAQGHGMLRDEGIACRCGHARGWKPREGRAVPLQPTRNRVQEELCHHDKMRDDIPHGPVSTGARLLSGRRRQGVEILRELLRLGAANPDEVCLDVHMSSPMACCRTGPGHLTLSSTAHRHIVLSDEVLADR